MSEQVIDTGLQQNVHSRDQQNNPLLQMRDRLFFALFCRVSVLYARSIPRCLQRILEFLLLFEALMAFGMLAIVHLTFVHEPVDCLQHVHDVWPKNGILRVEVIKNASSDYSLNDSYRRLAESSYLDDTEFIDVHEISSGIAEITDTMSLEDVITTTIPEKEKSQTPSFAQNLRFYFRPYLQHLKKLTRRLVHEEIFAVEYSLEYGLLRMNPKTRNHLNVTVMFVILDPTKDECFGGWFSQFILEEFLGYEDVLLSSVHQLATKQNNSGFFRNALSGNNYQFVEVSTSRASYVTAAFLMLFFTLSISMLLRYAHQQIFLFIVDLLQVFDRNSSITFPLAPLLTAVLALIGVEALMSELFTEASTAFYVILIVWLADQYDVICCHTNVSRRHWLRFFYLYHFVFYAYHYRFNGHFSSITLATSWLFIQHSMVYFFHHYELPAIIHQARVQRFLLQAQRQSMALQTTGRESTNLVDRPETSGSQQVNYGTVVAFIPEDLSNQIRAPDDVAEGVDLSDSDRNQRFGQQRQTWSLFNLPSFRFASSLVLAQVFVRQQSDSGRRSAEQIAEISVPVSQRTVNDENSNLVNVSEVHSRRLPADVGRAVSERAISPSCETPRGSEASADDANIPWQLVEKMDATDDDPSDKRVPIKVGNGKDGCERASVKTTVNAAADPEASFYQAVDASLQPCHSEQSAAEFNRDLAVLPDREVNSVGSLDDRPTSSAPKGKNCSSHSVYADKNPVFVTARNRDSIDIESGTNSETISSEVDDESRTHCSDGEIKKCDTSCIGGEIKKCDVASNEEANA